MRIFENVPELLRPDESREQWESRRKLLVDTIEKTEYGCRPEMDYQLSWNLRSREAVLDGKADRLICFSHPCFIYYFSYAWRLFSPQA